MSEDEHPGPFESAAVRLTREIRSRRTAARLSQPQLAVKVGYTRQYVSLAERPGHNLPSAELVTALDRALAADGALTALREEARHERAQSRRHLAGHPGEPPLQAGAVPAVGVDEVLEHLRAQWHLLVKTDNLFGPRFALDSVHAHLRLITETAGSARGAARRETVRLAAQYAESAAWLHEEAAEPQLARHWTDRAMEWACESGDRAMLAWTLFRRSQQATAENDPARAIGTAQAAHRDGALLAAPMRAAITQQEAHGHALDGDERATHRTLDHAHQWAAADADGEARGGHGSFCTAAYLELQRAHCWTVLGKPDKAVAVYQAALPALPAVYRRDCGTALARFATATAAVGDPEQAAALAVEALDITRGTGSLRTHHTLHALADTLAPHTRLPAVGAFRTALATDGPR